MATFFETVGKKGVKYMVKTVVTHRHVAIHYQHIYPNVTGNS